MSTADQLLPLILSWIEKREQCADKLIQLARELETLRKKCNAGECVGSSVAVFGAVCLIGAGLATLLTAGAAAPSLGMLGATSTGIGTAVSVGTKLLDAWISSDTMKEANKIEKRSNEIVDKIQQHFDKLRAEAKAENPSADPHELDQHIKSKILTSMARTNGVKGEVRIRWFNGNPQIILTEELKWSGAICVIPTYNVASSAMFDILACFQYWKRGNKYEQLFAKVGQHLVQQTSIAAGKTVLFGSFKVMGGAVLLGFALDEAIDNWKDMIMNNHVTEASQSLRDTANSIRKATGMLRKQLDSIRETLDEMVKCEQEQKEKGKKRKAEEEQEEKEKKRMAKVSDVVIVQSNCSVYDSHRNTDTRAKHRRRQTDKNGQKDSRCEKTGGQEAGGGKGEGTGGDTGGQSSSSDFTRDTTCQLRVSKDVDCEKIHQKDSEPSVPWCNMGHLNIRSMNNKKSRISKFINDFKLMVLTLTETWVKDMSKFWSGEFQFHHQPRVDEEGKPKTRGGVANGFSNELQGERVQFENMSFQSFEYVGTDLHHDGWNRPIRTITVYRRPGGNNQDMENFLEEFQNLLNKFSEDDCILITGDFNIKVNDKNDKHAKRFKKLLKKNGLTQHVKEETHQKHNTLDLVITRNVDISNLCVRKPKIKPKPKTETKSEAEIDKEIQKRTKKKKTISDHYAVLFSARPTSEKSSCPPSKQLKGKEK